MDKKLNLRLWKQAGLNDNETQLEAIKAVALLPPHPTA
jgi:hypothetical protein